LLEQILAKIDGCEGVETQILAAAAQIDTIAASLTPVPDLDLSAESGRIHMVNTNLGV